MLHQNEVETKYSIREGTSGDTADILEIHHQAFNGRTDVVDLTRDLLVDPSTSPMLSLLAIHDNKPAGHILFSNASIAGFPDNPLLHILAPLAIKPEYQRKQIGGLLIKEGLARLRAMGSKAVFVLGHPSYYPKSGFIPDAGKLGFPAPYPIPAKDADAWMVQFLVEDHSSIPRGKVICAKALDEPQHWRE
ncbi:MAG: N-acetyltransferase [Puniceicoccales bacterium]|jgi:putative acetyltransferase|nr:N-acetyltransferase [Puniceicoccales bacterium]